MNKREYDKAAITPQTVLVEFVQKMYTNAKRQRGPVVPPMKKK